MLLFRPDASQAEWSRQAIELAERHGWGEESLAGMAYAQLGIVLLYQGRLDEAEPWLERAERTLRTEVEPAAGMSLRYARAVLELARGRYQEALAAFRDAKKLAAALVGPHTCVTSMRSRMLQTLVRLGQTGRAGQALAELGEDERASARDADRDGGTAAGPATTRRQRRTPLGPSWTARSPESAGYGWYGTAAGGTEPATRWATRPRPGVPSSGPWISPGRAACSLPFLLDPVPALLERHGRGRARPTRP